MIEVSYGELIDKITILEIKSARISEPVKLSNIQKELRHLHDVLNAHGDLNDETWELMGDLRMVNNDLWDVEDQLRDLERQQFFESRFITLARSVYRLNDRRAAIKKNINTKMNSGMVEEKSYAAYTERDDLATIEVECNKKQQI